MDEEECDHVYVEEPRLMGQQGYERLRCRFCSGHFRRQYEGGPIIQIPAPE